MTIYEVSVKYHEDGRLTVFRREYELDFIPSTTYHPVGDGAILHAYFKSEAQANKAYIYYTKE